MTGECGWRGAAHANTAAQVFVRCNDDPFTKMIFLVSAARAAPCVTLRAQSPVGLVISCMLIFGALGLAGTVAIW